MKETNKYKVVYEERGIRKFYIAFANNEDQIRKESNLRIIKIIKTEI